MDWESKGVRFAPVRLVPRTRAETVTREQQSPAALGGGLVQASQALYTTRLPTRWEPGSTVGDRTASTWSEPRRRSTDE
jgi:hypothetical protein